MYPDEIVIPMREELTDNGVTETKTPEEVARFLDKKDKTTLVVVNSVCGCAAGSARPSVVMALNHAEKKPDNVITVFAGVDAEATKYARNLMLPYPPSSPSMALFKDGEVVHMIQRHHIEGRPPEMIANNLLGAFEQFC